MHGAVEEAHKTKSYFEQDELQLIVAQPQKEPHQEALDTPCPDRILFSGARNESDLRAHDYESSAINETRRPRAINLDRMCTYKHRCHTKNEISLGG